MRTMLWSTLERALPRGASALVSVVMAALLDPTALGVFTTVTIVLALVVSLFDVAARQVVLASRQAPAKGWFVQSYRRWWGPVAALLLLTGIVTLASVRADERHALLSMLPVVVVPVAGAVALEPLTSLQAAGRWHVVARVQAMAALGALAVSLPLALAIRSITAAAVHLALAEVLFTVLLWRAWGRGARDGEGRHGTAADRRYLVRQYGQLSLSAGVGWAQSQADRALVGALAGPAVLGLYAVAGSVARSAGEAVGAGASSVLRVELATAQDGGQRSSPQDLRRLVAGATRKALLLTAAVSVATVVVALLLLPPLLGQEWDLAVAAVPLFAASGLFTVLSWNALAVLQHENRVGRAVAVKVAGAVLALPVALAATHGVVLAAGAYLVREVVTGVALGMLSRRLLPARMLAVAVGLVAVVLLAACAVTWMTEGEGIWWT